MHLAQQDTYGRVRELGWSPPPKKSGSSMAAG
jgi:hypothetical protein